MFRHLVMLMATAPLAACGSSNTTFTPTDAATTDAPAVDAPAVDAPAVDAPAVDTPTVDRAPPVDATPDRPPPTDAAVDAADAVVPIDATPADVGATDVTPPTDGDRCAVRTSPHTPDCNDYYLLPCGLPAEVADAGMGEYLSAEVCMRICATGGFPSGSCRVSTADAGAGAVEVACMTCAVGRRPEGFVAVGHAHGASLVGRFFARVAALESGAVTAFARIADGLVAHGAPEPLVRDALAAADDEVRHTAQMGALARRFGAEPDEAPVPEAEPASLEAMALENAVEGCVRETFGALVATWQARASNDPAVARELAAVADDETRHAELSWRLADWYTPRASTPTPAPGWLAPATRPSRRSPARSSTTRLTRWWSSRACPALPWPARGSTRSATRRGPRRAREHPSQNHGGGGAAPEAPPPRRCIPPVSWSRTPRPPCAGTRPPRRRFPPSYPTEPCAGARRQRKVPRQ
ncbi:MAG: hypothetical protein U0325_34790 [Polyangiales bacterium]